MELEFKEKFLKDIEKIRHKDVKDTFLNLIDKIKELDNLSSLPNVKKLKGFKTFYRIRIGDYRIGIEYKNSTVTFCDSY